VVDGKVYYYLMERATGSAMPLHLQIIDLDLESEINAPVVSFPSPAVTVEQGYERLTLGIDAASPVEGRTIESVTLFINGEEVRVDNSLPYLFGHGSKPHETGAMGWREDHTPNPNPLLAGEHTFTAVALDSEGDTGVATMTLTVTSDAPLVSFPESAMTVNVGYEKLTIGIDAFAQGDLSIESVTLYIDDELVRVDNSLPYLFGHGSKPHETGAMGWREDHEPNPNPFGPGEYVFKAVALDSAGNESEAIMILTVEGEPEPPVVSFPRDVYEFFEGYEKFTFTLDAESPVPGRTVVSVGLYVNGELARLDTRPLWNFGHSFAPHETGAMGWLETHEPNPNPLGVGEHIFTAIATDSEGLTSEAQMTLIVNELPGPSVSFNESDVSILEGYNTLSLSINAETFDEDTNVISAGLYMNGSLVRELLEPPFVWGADNYADELLDLPAGSHVVKVEVTDSNGKIGETEMVIAVTLLGDLDGDGDVNGHGL